MYKLVSQEAIVDKNLHFVYCLYTMWTGSNSRMLYVIVSVVTALLTIVAFAIIKNPSPASMRMPISARTSPPLSMTLISDPKQDAAQEPESVIKEESTEEEPTEEVLPESITREGVLQLVNQQRSERGASPLVLNDKLNAGATAKCDDMSKNFYYEHKSPRTGKHGYSYAEDYFGSYDSVAENLNHGSYSSSEEVVDSWVRSRAHFRAMIDPKYTLTGIAICEVSKSTNGKKRPTVVQHFVGL